MNRLNKWIVVGSLMILTAGCGSSSGDDDDDSNVSTGCGGVVDISENAMVNGRLETGDCTANDIFPGSMDPTFVDEYRVTIATGGTLQITMRSTDFDTFLAILDTTTSCSGGCSPTLILGIDDDGGGGAGGTDSLISIMLAPGTYTILANSFDPSTGDYTLETVFM